MNDCGPSPVVQTDNTGLTSGSVFPTGTRMLTFETSNAAGATTCSIEVEVLPELTIKHVSGVLDGDTQHIAACLPPYISRDDLDLGPHQNQSSLNIHIYTQQLPLPEERPAGL